jgi:hypothetical protein
MQSDGTLQLVFADPSVSASGRTLIVPQLPGTGADRLVSAVFDATRRRRRLLPAPPPDAPPPQLRAWHRDAWLALGETAASTLLVATGPTAAHLAPVLGDRALTVALVREPLAVLGAVDAGGVPVKRIGAALAGEEPAEVLRRWSNPQSRALLAPWHDTDDLALGVGPPEDAERWRELLFGDVLSRVTVTADAEAFARRVGATLGSARKRAVRIAAALAEDGPAVRRDPGQDEMLRSVSWLDAELYERASGSGLPA